MSADIRPEVNAVAQALSAQAGALVRAIGDLALMVFELTDEDAPEREQATRIIDGAIAEVTAIGEEWKP